MNNLSTQHIKFAKIEQEHAWIFVAVLVEERNGHIIPIAQPKVVKIIPKKSEILLLDAPKVFAQGFASFVSPYVSVLFNDFEFDLTLAPRPPTHN